MSDPLGLLPGSAAVVPPATGAREVVAVAGPEAAGRSGPLPRRRRGRHLARPLHGGPVADPIDPETLLRVLAGLRHLPDPDANEPG